MCGDYRTVPNITARPDLYELPYFRGKALVEQHLVESGLSHAILRPAVLFGGDGVLTGDEYRAMAAGLADTDGPATGTTRLSAWLADNAQGLGRSYANELNRHFREAEKV